jgi:hypothetical protein
MGCPLTPTRLIWLEHLAKHGLTGWHRMPQSKLGRPVTNLTWQRMRSAGLITGTYTQPTWRDQWNWYFDITPVGRAALEKSKETA